MYKSTQLVLLFTILACNYTSSQNTCTNGICNCDTGYLPSSDNIDCLPYATEYGAECYENAQCKYLHDNYECVKKCVCKKGFRWYQGRCQSFAILDGACATDDECFDGYDPFALKCTDGKCSCSDNHYRHETDCRKKSSPSLLCALDSDCQVQDTSSICIKGKCMLEFRLFLEKPEEKPENKNRSTSKQIEYTSCEQDDECVKNDLNSFCFADTKTCACIRGFFPNENGRCIQELGMESGCKEDTDCSIKPGVCNSGTCYCRDYYVVSADNRNCIKTMSQRNPNCLSREWCSPLGPNAYCSSEEVCKCSQIAELTNDTFCSQTKPVDPSLCQTDIDCKNIRTICKDEKCQCEDQHRLENGECLPNIEAACNVRSPCTIKSSNCDSKSHTCQCNRHFVATSDKLRCRPVRDKLMDQCDDDVQCQVKDSLCLEGKCRCNEAFIEHITKSQNSCIRKRAMNDDCISALECSLSLGATFQCRKQVCQCPTGTKLVDSECSSSLTIQPQNLMVLFIIIVNGFIYILR